ncbi:MAG: hypothetical protein JNL28_15235 [Planctomycetes bacterium]|nr:hypothetical protein [Planctomycetota bacterium]
MAYDSTIWSAGPQRTRGACLSGAIAGALLLAGRAEAQLLHSHGRLVALTGQATPGAPGAAFAGAGAFDLPQIDRSGAVLFRARFVGGGATSSNDRALFYGAPGAIRMTVRDGASAPGLPPGVTLNTSAGAGGLTSTYLLSASGNCAWTTSLWNGGTSSLNDTAIYGGMPLQPVLVAREGDPAPGTIGPASLVSSYATMTHYELQVSERGDVCFRTAMYGGDVSGSLNNGAIYAFHVSPGTMHLLARMYDPILGGYRVGPMAGPPPYAPVQLMNDAGQLLWECGLNLGLGTPLPTAQDDQVLVLSSAGGTHAVIAREGDLAPGAGGARYGAASGTSRWRCDLDGLSPAGDVVFMSDLKGPGVESGIGNMGLFYRAHTGSTELLIRRGDAAPGTSGERINLVVYSPPSLNTNGQFAFRALIFNAEPTENIGVWSGNVNVPGSLELIARRGDPAPGTLGARLSGPLDTMQNNQDAVVIDFFLTGGDVSGAKNNRALYCWTKARGLQLIVRKGDSWAQIPGRTISTFVIDPFPSTSGLNVCFNAAGQLAVLLTLDDGSEAIATIDVTGTPSTTFCAGDGTSTPCPCGNSGSFGRGCASSAFAIGAGLTTLGTAGTSLATDSLILTATNVVGPCMFFQGTGTLAGGTGIPFGDGLFCTGGTVVRLGVVIPAGTGASFPEDSIHNPIHVVGATTAGDLRYYQCWYRDAVAFCTPASYNLTPGASLVWGP